MNPAPSPEVLVEPSFRLPLAHVVLRLPAGAAHDPLGRAGTAELVARCLRKGSTRRSGDDIEDRLEELGAELEADLDHDGLDLTLDVLSSDFEAGLSLLFEVAFQPSFPTKAVRSTRALLLDDLAASAEDPDELADAWFATSVYGAHPYARSSWGTQAEVGSLGPDSLRRFHRTRYRPADAIVGVAGAIDPEHARTAVADAARRALTVMPPPLEARPRPRPAPPRGEAPGTLVIHRPGLEQTYLRLGALSISADAPDLDAIEVASFVLGGGMTSRLVDEVRARRGLCYDIRTGFDAGADPGAFWIETSTRHETAPEALAVIGRELERFRADGPDEAEFHRAVANGHASFGFDTETPEDILHERVDAEFYGRPRDWNDRTLDRLDALTPDEVRRVARDRFPAGPWHVIAVTDVHRARAAVTALNPARILDGKSGRSMGLGRS